MSTITFWGFTLTIISMEDMVKETPHTFFKAQLRMKQVSPGQLPGPSEAQN